MRIATDRDDPDFVGENNYGHFRVEVDGRPVPKAIEADDVAGYVVAHAWTEGGGFQLNEARDDTVKVTMRGMVRIIDTRQAA